MSFSFDTWKNVSIRFDYLKSRHVILPSSFESRMKKILMTTVSAYLSWNSGVAYKNSSPGCVSSRYLKRGLKSSGTMTLCSFYAMVLKVRLLTGSFSNSRLKKLTKLYFGILSPSIFSLFFTYSNSIFLKMVGTPHTSLITGSNSARVTEPSLNAFSIAVSFFCLVSFATGLPSGK